MHQTFDRGVVAGLVLLAALTAGVAVTSYLNTRHLRDDAGRAARSRERLDAVSEVRVGARRLQAEQRAYIITGAEDRLEPYRATAAALRGAAEKLARLNADDPAQAARAETVGLETEEAVRGLDEVIAIRRAGGYEAVRAFSQARGPRSYVDPALEALAAMDRAERDRIAALDRATARAYDRAVVSGAVGLALGLVALGLFVWVLRRAAAVRGREALAQDRLAAIVSSSDDAIVSKALDGTVLTWNAGAERLFGYAAAEVVGRPITLLIPPDRWDEEKGLLERLARGERVDHFETVRRRKDGRPIDVSVSVSPLRDETGRVVAASKVARDITAVKRIERELGEARRRSEAALQAGEVATYYWDVAADRVTGDRNFVAIFGVLAADRPAAPVAEFLAAIHPDDRERVAAEIGRTLATDAPFESAYRIARADGARWVIARGTVERDAGGRPVGWAGALVDVTRQREAEERLRVSEERRRLALDAAGLGTWNIDAATSALTTDERFRAVFHGSADPLGFEQAFAAIHPDDRGRVRAAVAAAMRPDAPAPYREEYRVVHPDGSVHWIAAAGRAGFEGAGAGRRLVSLDGTVGDVTDRVSNDQEGERLHAQIETDRRLLDAVFDALPVGLVIAEPGGRLVRMNRANEELWGGPPPTNSIAEYRPWVGYWPDTGARIEPHEWALARVLTAGETVAGDRVRIERFGDGAERTVVISGAPVRDAAGRLVAGVIALIDVTARERAEERLRDSEERFRSLFESMDEGYCVVEPVLDGAGRAVDYRYLLANPALGHHTGLRDVVGRTAREVMPGHESHWIETYGRVAATGESVRRTDYVADLGRWFDVSAFRVGPPARGHVGVLFTDVTARKRAEDAVRASEGQLAEVFRHAPSFMGVLRGPDHVFERVNDRYVQLVGGRELVGRAVREALPEVVAQGFVELLDRVYRTGEPFVGADARVALEPGGGGPAEERYIDFVYQPLRDPAGAVTGIIVQGIDQTERKRTEALLREKDQRLELFLGAATDYAVVITDADGRITDWLGGAEAIVGFTRAEAVGQSAELIFTPADRAAGVPAREMATAARTGRAEDKRWHRRKDGSEFFADGVMVPLRGDGGGLRGFGKVFRDATARKRTEDGVRFLADASATLAELVDYESTLQRIANLAVGLFADWCVVDVMDETGARRRLAVTAPEDTGVAGPRAADAADPVAPGAVGGVPHVLQTGEPEVVPDLAALDPATAPLGPERMARLRAWGVTSYIAVPLVTRSRVVGGITFLGVSARRRYGPAELAVAADLAQRVATAIENAQLYRALQEQDRRKDEFLATLAHELRNPLAPVRNGVQILRMAVPAGAGARTLDMMDRQLGQMVHLVDDLMDVSRVSRGKVVLRPEPVPVRALIDAAVETARQTIDKAGHELVLDVPAEPLVVAADRTRLVQVLANLLNNAAKYTPNGGRITVAAARQGADAVIRVADTGLGIAADMLPRVFEMFTQVGSSLDRAQGGLGIGLTLVRRLVELHGGSVSAESPGPGRGSTFRVRLPLAETPAPANGPAPPAGRPDAAPARFDILVVDDNRDSAESLAELLEMMGHAVRTAHDGPAALRELEGFRPDLVLLDLGLPGMSGYEVARRIRESVPLRGVTLAALTGWGQDEDRRRTREAGFDHHLVKPADPGAVVEVLQAVQRHRTGGE